MTWPAGIQLHLTYFKERTEARQMEPKVEVEEDETGEGGRSVIETANLSGPIEKQTFRQF